MGQVISHPGWNGPPRQYQSAALVSMSACAAGRDGFEGAVGGYQSGFQSCTSPHPSISGDNHRGWWSTPDNHWLW